LPLRWGCSPEPAGGAQLGILIKGPQVLEDTRTVDTILLDKTGTVTTGKLAVDTALAFDG